MERGGLSDEEDEPPPLFARVLESLAPMSVIDQTGRRVVRAPPGPLGILITASQYGTPQIGSVEPGSVLCGAVECGDLLLSVGEARMWQCRVAVVQRRAKIAMT